VTTKALPYGLENQEQGRSVTPGITQNVRKQKIQGHPEDLSRCASEDEFVEKLTIALKNQRHATRPGGYYGAIIGDVRKAGVYSSYQADIITWMPKSELQAVLIKQQHNMASNGRDYPLRLPRIMHEYVVLWQRRRTVSVVRPRGEFRPSP
jgi:hypothetical protein